jgi:hypothetical protein
LHPVPSFIRASAAVVKLSKPTFFLLPLAFAARSPVCLQRLPADPLSPSGTPFHRFLASPAPSNHSSFDHVRQVMLPEGFASAERMQSLEMLKIEDQ